MFSVRCGTYDRRTEDCAISYTQTAAAEAALAEAVHRARNDLAAVAAMLCLTAKDVSDPAARAAMLDVEARVRALSSLNARLDLRTGAAIDAADFLGGLATDFERTHLRGRPILLDLRAEPHPLPVAQAKPLGLIVNELLVNALKYAFPGGRGGVVGVVFECRDGACALTVKDDGVGMDPAAPPRGTGLGRRMARTLAAQIGGTFQIGPGADGGTRCTVRWRLRTEDVSGTSPPRPVAGRIEARL